MVIFHFCITIVKNVYWILVFKSSVRCCLLVLGSSGKIVLVLREEGNIGPFL
jgi:hypothetical protein